MMNLVECLRCAEHYEHDEENASENQYCGICEHEVQGLIERQEQWQDMDDFFADIKLNWEK